MNAGAPIVGMSDRATVVLGLLILLLVCAPLLLMWAMTPPRRPRHRPSVATTAEPLALLGFVDRSGPPVFDVERFDGPDPRAGQHLSDAEVVAVAEALNGPGERWSATPNADDVEDWLADLTRRRNTP